MAGIARIRVCSCAKPQLLYYSELGETFTFSKPKTALNGRFVTRTERLEGEMLIG